MLCGMTADRPALFGVGAEGLVELPSPAGAATVHDALAVLPAGAYSTVRTFLGTRFLGLEWHLARLESSIRLMGHADPPDRALLLRVLDDVATRVSRRWTEEDSVIRFDVPAQPARVGATTGTVFLAAAPLVPVPETLRRDGVAVETTDRVRRHQPLVKSSEFVRKRGRLPAASSDCYERILLDGEDRLLEGTSSSFYAIAGDEILTTRDGVLEGVTRRILLERARALGIPVRHERLPRVAVPNIDGAFLSSSSRGVVPIVRIDGIPVGDGKPHALVTRLSGDYDAWAASHARPALELL